MDKGKKLAKNTLVILVGKICTQFISFFLLPLYTSILSSSDYGTVDLIITYIGLIVPIITLNLENATFRYLIDVREDKNGKKQIITNSFQCVLVQYGICLAIYLMICQFIDIPYKYILVINVLATMLSSFLLQVAKGLGKMIDFSIGSAIAGVCTVILNIFFLLILKVGVYGILLSSAIANILCFIYLLIKCKIPTYLDNSKKDLQVKKELLKYSIPLIPNGVIWWIIDVSDRTIITMFLGSASNGIYAIANKFSSVLMQLFNVFNISWTESAAVNINEEDRNDFFSKTFNHVIKLFGCACVLIISIMPFVFHILIGSNFIEAYVYIPLLLIGSLFNVIVAFLGGIYVAKKMTKQVATTSFWSGILNVVINVLLVKRIGITAAAISTILAFAIMSVYRFIDVQKYVKLKLEIKSIILVVVLFIVSCMGYYMANTLVKIAILTVSCVLTMYLNKEMIDSMKIIVKTKLVKK